MQFPILHKLILPVCAYTLLTCTFPFPLYATNLIQNPGFEQGLDTWRDQTGSGSISSQLVSDSHSGSQALEISNTKTSSFGHQQTLINIESGSTYRLKGWAKGLTSALKSSKLRIAWYTSPDGSGKQIATADTNEISSATDWQLLHTDVTAPAQSKSAKIRLVLASTENGQQARAIFDDLELSSALPSPTPIFEATPNPTSSPTATPKFKAEEPDDEVEIISIPKPTSKQFPTHADIITPSVTPIPTNETRNLLPPEPSLSPDIHNNSSTSKLAATFIGIGLCILTISGYIFLKQRSQSINFDPG